MKCSGSVKCSLIFKRFRDFKKVKNTALDNSKNGFHIFKKNKINEVVLSKILRKTKLSLSLPELWFNLLLCTLLCYPNQTFEKNNFILILKGVIVSFYWFGNSNETTGRTKCSALKWKNKITPKKKKSPLRIHTIFLLSLLPPQSQLLAIWSRKIN